MSLLQYLVIILETNAPQLLDFAKEIGGAENVTILWNFTENSGCKSLTSSPCFRRRFT